ncbi:Hypothetical protein CINCED_3A017699 [Cinara cedri]|uniref:Uncharacterized protein n=2 Tax=Cinara cedri TaxID=506608 RepID=A0A5E4M4A4_9HEMI|nr:Hypothetical protein CINCED_3A017699 [Cinara cedri]
MAYGNQWMNPTHYKNMTNEQVDWASLAQQWIKMKETTPVIPLASHGRTATNETNLIGTCQLTIDSQNSSHLSAQNKTLADHSVASSISGNAVEKPSAWNTWTWQQQQQWNWNWASSSAPPIKTTTMDPVNPIRPPYVTPPLLTEPPPSFPMISSNKQFPSNNYWAGPNTRIPPPIESDQWSKPNMLPNVDDRVQDPSFIDATKRKQLPAWIREGLEKMEKKKRQKMELDNSFEKHDYSSLDNEIVSQELCNSPNSFDHETQMVDDEIEHSNSPEYINDAELNKSELMKNDPTLLIPRKTKAQIWDDTMLNLRHTLTKLLMEVTNDMMLSVTKEVLKTTNLQADKQGNQSKTSLAGKLGLSAYGSASETSDEDDEEQLSGHKQFLSQNSDEAIKQRLLKRQQEFINTEAKILMELDQLEDREKHVRSTFDNSVRFSGDTNDSRQAGVKMKNLVKNLKRDMIKVKEIYLMSLVTKMAKKKRNLNQRDHQVLVHLAVVVKVEKVMTLIVNTDIKKMKK